MDIGTLLRRLRDKKKISSREIASRIGIAHSTFMDWEHDKTSPSLKQYSKLASALDINPVELMAYLTGQTDTILLPQHKDNIQDLSEMIRFYKSYRDLFDEQKLYSIGDLPKGHEHVRVGDPMHREAPNDF
jgi:transcriptional regulator with XRE-family HTH domain